jgi:hypothetical protein
MSYTDNAADFDMDLFMQALGYQRGGVSANCLHGFERFNLQNVSCRGDTRRRGSADHLVRLEEEGRGNGEADGLRGRQVDDELKPRRLLHR